MPRVKVRVLRTDLMLGERDSNINNPIALAIARVFPGLRRHVHATRAMVGTHTLTLSPGVQAFLRKWQSPQARSLDFQPFGFLLECPKKLADQARRQKPATKKKPKK